MSEKWVVALDQGTSSCRAMAVDCAGNIRTRKMEFFSPQRPAEGLSQYDADALLTSQLRILHQLLDEIGPERAAAIAVCSQRSTVILWNKQTGQAVAPVLTWEDGRAWEQTNRADISQAEIHQQTGLFKAPFFSAPKIAWCLQHIPAAAETAAQGNLLVAPVASYLIWKLTDGKTFATDPTLAQRTLLWNLHSRQWSASLGKQFGVPLACLPEIRPSASLYGDYTYKGVTIPIRACVADQQAAAVYHGLTVQEATVNYGTGAFVLYHTGNQPAVLPGMLSSVAASTNPQEISFLLEGPIFAAGSLLQWLQVSRGVVFEKEQLDALCAAATSPVSILPALGGLGAPYWDYQTRMTTAKVSATTTKADWLAGALQSIAGRVADIFYYLEEQGLSPRKITASGGLSNSNYLLQTQADMLGRVIHVQPQPEGTVLGAAHLVAEQLGWNTAKWEHPDVRTFSPLISSQTSRDMYFAWQQFVQQSRVSKTY